MVIRCFGEMNTLKGAGGTPHYARQPEGSIIKLQKWK
jgi:hypothetical protein